MRYFQLFGLLFLLLISCERGFEGEETANKAPETDMVVDTIIRSGDNRFVSQVLIQWWGSDPDGFVSGFEYSTDGSNWEFTERQDSVFFVQLPEGKDTFDFNFRVRAIDNEGLQDPTPASLVYPVRNSAPTINFVKQEGASGNPARNPRKTFPILLLQWKASDRDGQQNIDYFEFVLNDTTASPVRIAADYSSLTLEALNPGSDTSSCRLLLGTTLSPHEELARGLKLNALNTFYIRAVDKVGASSWYNSSRSIYVKKVVSKVLLVNAYQRNVSLREDFFIENLKAIGIDDFDTIRVNEVVDNTFTQLAADNPTQSRIFAMFDVLIWFGSDAAYTLTLAQRTTGDFLDNGGKLFASVFFSTSVDEQSSYLDYTPIDSLVEPSGGVFFMDKDAEATATLDGWPDLKSDKIITSTRPFVEKFAAEPLYDATLRTVNGPWNGKSTIMAKRENNMGETDFIISSIELYRLNGNGNMPLLFEKIFKEELGL